MSWKNSCYLLVCLFVIQMSCVFSADKEKFCRVTEEPVDVFMPGRFCLFGEHSDWAAIYREDNPLIEKGMVIATGTDQGIYAHVKHHPDRFIFSATIPSFSRISRCEIPMTKEELQEQTRCGGHFSYIASVALQILNRFPVEGIEIDNYKTDLPVRCGYGASGAACLLVARAFNRLYNLGLTLEEEQELAFLGETATQSRCGRLDYVCAYGKGPFKLVFDRSRVDVEKITVGRDLYFVIVALTTEKDTVKILNSLNRCYPFAKSEIQENVQNYLGPMNVKIVTEAVKAIESGDDQKIGELMRETQRAFDEYVAPACPSQLTAPVLHKVLAYPPIQPYIYGGKGMGSQGDGSLQLIVKNKEAQEQVIRILKKDFDMNCLPLTISRT
jgi:galactokinase